MQDLLQPLIHKAAVQDIAVNVARSGLSIGDEAELHSCPDGQLAVFAVRTRRIIGLFPRRHLTRVGVLGPQAESILSAAVENGDLLRVRIVGLTPEHLVTPGGCPEIHISVWGDPRVLPAAKQGPKRPLSA